MVLDTSEHLPLSDTGIRSLTQSAFHHYPCPSLCHWQVKAVETVLKRDRDVITIAGMDMGKTLTFWMPLLFSLQVTFTGKW